MASGTINGAATSIDHRRRTWRRILLVLVLLPFLPELMVLAAAALAQLKGCALDAASPCMLGPVAAATPVRAGLAAGTLIGIAFGFGGAALWLALSAVAIALGWAELNRRLLLAAAVCLVLALGPYIAPLIAIEPLVNPHCHPNEGGVGPCVIYGGEVGEAGHATVTLPFFAFVGVPLAAATFAIFAIVLVILRFAAKRRAAAPA